MHLAGLSIMLAIRMEKILVKLKRMGRKQFFGWALLQGLVFWGTVALLATQVEENEVAALAAIAVLTVSGLIVTVYLTICRLWDLGSSGWWAFLALPLMGTPYLFWIPLGIFLFIPGDLTENKYGPATV
jgi:uncharacterized membrane protein YhaH (DUF805 family)